MLSDALIISMFLHVAVFPPSTPIGLIPVGRQGTRLYRGQRRTP